MAVLILCIGIRARGSAHGHLLAAADLAKVSAYSFIVWPEWPLTHCIAMRKFSFAHRSRLLHEFTITDVLVVPFRDVTAERQSVRMTIVEPCSIPEMAQIVARSIAMSSV